MDLIHAIVTNDFTIHIHVRGIKRGKANKTEERARRKRKRGEILFIDHFLFDSIDGSAKTFR